MTRHRIFSEPTGNPTFPRMWRVQVAGQERPINEAALTWAGAVELLDRRLAVDAYWRAHDPLADLPGTYRAPRLRRSIFGWLTS